MQAPEVNSSSRYTTGRIIGPEVEEGHVTEMAISSMQHVGYKVIGGTDRVVSTNRYVGGDICRFPYAPTFRSVMYAHVGGFS